jgi:protein phosphatase-4 regulatory subunit 3
MESVSNRVKVYKLVDGVWDDRGTGYVEFAAVEPNGNLGIVVKAEDELTEKVDPKKFLLKTKVAKEDIYLKQQETLVVWNEASPNANEPDGVDFSLSFQEATGCKEFWNELKELQNDFQYKSQMSDDLLLPYPSANNLDAIDLFLESLSAHQTEILVNAIIEKSFLLNLFGLFKSMIQLQDSPYAQRKKMLSITKKLFQLNSKDMVEHLCDKHFNDVLFVLENDPDSDINHSDFINNQVKFEMVIPLNNDSLVARIHQTFRLMYLRDVALPKIMEPTEYQTIATLGTMVLNNSTQIVNHFISSELPDQLIAKMTQPNLPSQVLSHCCKLIVDLLNHSSHLELRSRLLFFGNLTTAGLLGTIQNLLLNNEVEIRKSCTLILLHAVDLSPSILRAYIIAQKLQGYTLLKNIISTFKQEPNYVTKTLLFEVLRGTLDTLHIGPEELTLNQIMDFDPLIEEEKHTLIQLFYQEFALSLFEPLFLEPPKTLHTPIDTFLKSSLCDLLATFVDHFVQQTKNFIHKNSIIPKLYILLKAKEKNLLLGPVRVLRRMVSTANKLYHNYIIENNLFAPIVQIFLENGEKYNALNSAILDLFDYISKPKNACHSLAKHFIDNFYGKVKNITYVSTFKNLHFFAENPESVSEDQTNNNIALDFLSKEKAKPRLQSSNSSSAIVEPDYISSYMNSYSDSDLMLTEPPNSPRPVTKRKFEEQPDSFSNPQHPNKVSRENY